MTDDVRPSPTLSDTDQELYKLTLAEVQVRFTEAGMPRSYRSIQRFCERGRLDCLKTDTPNGEQYFVSEASVVRAIEELRQLWALKNLDGHVQPELATPSHVALDTATPTDPDTVRQSPTVSEQQGNVALGNATTTVGKTREDTPGQTWTEPDAVSKYVARLERDNDRLEKELDVKNEQIAALLERDRETNVLVGSLQRMLAPLLGTPDPRRTAREAPEYRESQSQG